MSEFLSVCNMLNGFTGSDLRISHTTFHKYFGDTLVDDGGGDDSFNRNNAQRRFLSL